MTHICISKITIIGSDNGLSPGRHQAIFWTNAGILSIGHLGTKFREILIEIHTFSFKKMHLKRSSGKYRPFCLGLNVFREQWWFFYTVYIGSISQFLQRLWSNCVEHSTRLLFKPKISAKIIELTFLHARPWIPDDDIAIFTAVIH